MAVHTKKLLNLGTAMGDGWTKEDTAVIHCFCLRHNILLEEKYGLQVCKVIVHNIIHLRDRVRRFGAVDNYWCYVHKGL